MNLVVVKVILTNLNIFITTEILKCHIEDKCGVKVDYDFNSNIGNTLNLDIEDKWGLEGFDAVIGNPPYEEVSEDTGESKGGTNQYTKFINYNIDKLNNNGYLLFINPISWIGPSTNKQSGNDLLHNVFLKYDLLYLNLNECKKYFKEGSTFCFYLLNKNITDCMTGVISKYKNEISISKINFKNYKNMKFLPIHITEETIDLVNSVINNKKNKLKICRSRKLDTSTKFGKEHLSLVKNEKFKYITYHTTSKTFYSDIKLENFNNSKILLNMSGHLNPVIVDNCNITESKFFIELQKEEDKKLLNIFKNNNIKKYLELCKYSGFNSRIVLENITYNLDDLDSDSLNEDVKPAIEIEIKIDDIIDPKKYTCECGNTLNKTGKLKHEQSLKHKKFIESK